MQGTDVNRRVICLGLASVFLAGGFLAGCDQLGRSAAERVATLNVEAGAKAALVASVQRFADLHGFEVKIAVPGQATLKLVRADMEISLSNDASGDGNPLAWEVTCYRSRSVSKATTAEIDELADEFLASALAVPGVLLISSNKALPDAPPPASSAAAASSL